VPDLTLGTIVAAPAGERQELLGAPVAALVDRLGWGERIGVFEIDPALSETAATRERYGLDPATLVNCVVVAGRREGEERIAACLVPSTKRADVNGVVRRRLEVRKASFLQQDAAVERTGMAYGGITPIGLPDGWPILVDAEVVATPIVLIGSGIRGSKLLVPGALLGELPSAEVVEGLGRPIA
jgi:prolyl-tRNA editing enzyme YbaK/EbsC (Cys-tRNA(Pro) deacylase)